MQLGGSSDGGLLSRPRTSVGGGFHQDGFPVLRDIIPAMAILWSLIYLAASLKSHGVVLRFQPSGNIDRGEKTPVALETDFRPAYSEGHGENRNHAFEDVGRATMPIRPPPDSEHR